MKKSQKKIKMISENTEKFLGLRDLATQSGLSESFIRKLKSEKNLPHYKIGGRVFYKYSEFNKWMTTQGKC